MKIFLLCLLTVFACSIFSSCEAQTKLPPTMPPDAEIIYLSEGGFVPSYFSIAVSGGTMKVVSQPAEKERVVWEAKLSDEEVKNLYRVLVENKFDSIKPNQDAGVADGQTRSIELKFGGKRFYTVQGDGIKQTKNDAERFGSVENALGDLVKKYGKH